MRFDLFSLEPPEHITKQTWWSEYQAAKEAKKAASEAKPAGTTSASAAKTTPAKPGMPTPARGGPAKTVQRGAATSAGRRGQPAMRNTAGGRGAAASATSARGAASRPPTSSSRAVSRGVSQTTSRAGAVAGRGRGVAVTTTRGERQLGQVVVRVCREVSVAVPPLQHVSRLLSVDKHPQLSLRLRQFLWQRKTPATFASRQPNLRLQLRVQRKTP